MSIFLLFHLIFFFFSFLIKQIGAPQVLRTNSENGHTVSVRRGESATLSLVVCADPRPRHVAWEWGSLRLEAGAGVGKEKRKETSTIL